LRTVETLILVLRGAEASDHILFSWGNFMVHLTWVWHGPAPRSPALTHCFPEVGLRCPETTSGTWSGRWLHRKLTHRNKKQRVTVVPNQEADPSQTQSAITATQRNLATPANGFLWRGKRFRFLSTCCRFSREAGVHVPILLKSSAKATLVPRGESLSSQTAFVITQMSEEEVTDLPPSEWETEESEMQQKQLQTKCSFKNRVWNWWGFTL